MNFEVVIILILGVLILVVNYLLFSKISNCPPIQVKYNYIPRTEEEAVQTQVSSQDLEKLFTEMFDRASPWVDRMNNRRIGLNTDNINLYYISQS